MSEIRTYKETWPTDMSPTTILVSRDGPVRQRYSAEAACGVGGGVPGVGDTGVAGRGTIPGTQPDRPRYPYLVIFKAKEPTHGQMKAILRFLMRFLRLTLRMDPE